MILFLNYSSFNCKFIFKEFVLLIYQVSKKDFLGIILFFYWRLLKLNDLTNFGNQCESSYFCLYMSIEGVSTKHDIIYSQKI